MNCLAKKAIVNPLAINIMSVTGEYILHSVIERFDPKKAYYNNILCIKKYLMSCYDDSALETSFVFDPLSKTYIPLFIECRCGQCILCRQHRTSEWVTRCMAETATSTTSPLFLTLTYNNDHIDPLGVSIEFLQRFLKRLRIQLKRAGYDNSIRYIACGEYGSKTHRPHYHLILWNFPEMATLSKRLSFIEKSYALLGDSPGYSYVTIAQHSAIRYVLKYMQKTQITPAGKNPGFFLASRNRGIGYQYAINNRDHLSDPRVTKISIPCSDGYIHNAPIPAYFRSVLYPSNSQLIGRNAILSLKNLHCLYKDYIALSQAIDTIDYSYLNLENVEAMLTSLDHIIPFKQFRIADDDYARWTGCTHTQLSLIYDEMMCVYNSLLYSHFPTKEYNIRRRKYISIHGAIVSQETQHLSDELIKDKAKLALINEKRLVAKEII